MATPPLPESCSRLTPLYRGALLQVDDWCCAGHDAGRPAEEWCGEDQFALTRQGAWALETAGTWQLAEAGTVTWWTRHESYRVRHPVPGGDRCTVVRLTAAGSGALARERSAGAGRRPRPVDGPTFLAHRVLLTRARRHGAADPLALEEPALDLVCRVLPEPPTAPAAPKGHASVAAAREYIARHWPSRLSLSDIARHAGCSPFHLGRLFRRELGTSLYRWVVRLRLRHGLERLLDQPDEIARIALDCGFASHSHFTDAFRDEYRVSPREARRLACAGRGRRAASSRH